MNATAALASVSTSSLPGILFKRKLWLAPPIVL